MTGERRLSGVPRDSGLESREKLRDINRSLEDRCDGVAHWRQIYSPSSRKKIPPLPFARFTEKFRWPLVIDYPIRTAQKKSSRDIKEKKTNKDISNRRKRKKGKKTTTCIDLYRIDDAALQKVIYNIFSESYPRRYYMSFIGIYFRVYLCVLYTFFEFFYFRAIGSRRCTMTAPMSHHVLPSRQVPPPSLCLYAQPTDLGAPEQMLLVQHKHKTRQTRHQRRQEKKVNYASHK
jgi:hypothetical protein